MLPLVRIRRSASLWKVKAAREMLLDQGDWPQPSKQLEQHRWGENVYPKAWELESFERCGQDVGKRPSRKHFQPIGNITVLPWTFVHFLV